MICLFYEQTFSTFPTYLPTNQLTVYQELSTSKIVYNLDFISKIQENEIIIKDIKRVLTSIVSIDTNLIAEQLTRIMDMLKRFLNKAIGIKTATNKDYTSFPVTHTIQHSSLNDELKQYQELANKLALLAIKHDNLSSNKKKRDLDNSFPTISVQSLFIEDPVGCRLTIRYKVRISPCLFKYLALIKSPKMIYIGSDILTFLKKIFNRVVPLVNKLDTQKVIDRLMIQEQISELEKRDKRLYLHQPDIVIHLVELIETRLLQGASPQQISLYNDISKMGGLESISQPELDELDELEENTEQELNTVQPTLTPDSTIDNDDNNEQVTIQPNTITPETTTTTTTSTTATTIIPQILQDTTDPTNTVLSAMGDILKYNALRAAAQEMGTQITTLTNKYLEHEAQTSEERTKSKVLANFNVNFATPVILANGIANINDFFSQLEDDVRILEDFLNDPSKSSLIDKALPTMLYTIEDFYYSEKEFNFIIVVISYDDTQTVYQYEKLPFCGQEHCITINFDLFFGLTINPTEIFYYKDCSKIKENKYHCENKTTTLPTCLDFHISCDFTTISRPQELNRLYLDQYLFYSAPIDTNIEYLDGNMFEKNSFNILTVNTATSIVLNNNIFLVKATGQPFRLTVNDFVGRTLIDDMVNQSLEPSWYPSQTILNSIGIIIISMFMATYVLIWAIVKCKNKKRPEKTKGKSSYFRVGKNRVYLDPPTELD